ncbi:GNAT family N-acetyltransferase [Halorientalis pallida]|uniref:GNAT family N-acetyltransferase n=1 Tax=Halorientalis pallida TaxID=2479928 RepID=UPI00187D5F68|nr:GNAT family N-acetyltransferase [Halorientalis pallida]
MCSPGCASTPHQRQGYGQRLLAELTRRARELGYRDLLLDTDPDQTAPQAFYQANGFQRTGTVDVEGFDDLTLVLYRTRLDSSAARVVLSRLPRSKATGGSGSWWV